MRVAIMGAGGVGGYFGARLAEAGHDVLFVARGAHKEAMETEGLTVRSPLGDIRLAQPRVAEDLAGHEPCEAVLFCVKLWDAETAAGAMRPLVGPATAVVPLQNGVTVADSLSRILGAAHVLGAVTRISASIEAPGVIRHHGSFAQLVFGELDGAPSERTDHLRAACETAGIEARVAPAIEVDIWHKFVLLAPMAGATAFYRVPIGGILDDAARRDRLAAMVRETAAVGRAKGIALAADLETRTLEALAAMPAEMKASMLVDLERGKRLELPWLNGEVVRLGRELGVATPENAAVAAALEPYALGAVAAS